MDLESDPLCCRTLSQTPSVAAAGENVDRMDTAGGEPDGLVHAITPAGRRTRGVPSGH